MTKTKEGIEVLETAGGKKTGKLSKNAGTSPEVGTDSATIEATEQAAMQEQEEEYEIIPATATPFTVLLDPEETELEEAEPLGKFFRRASGKTAPPIVESSYDSPGTRPTTNQMVGKIKGILTNNVGKGFDETGAYILKYRFDDNYEAALSRNPHKGTSLNELASHKDMPLNRQRLAECVKAAAVGQECAALGLNSDALTFYHKVEISKLKTQEARVKLAQKVISEDLTVREVRDCLRELSGKPAPTDKRLGQKVMKQLRKLSGVRVDEDTRDFLTDKKRLKEAFSTGETAALLDHSEKFRQSLAESGELLQRLEKTLVEIVVEARQGEAAEAKPQIDE
jgi:hypothetical protein